MYMPHWLKASDNWGIKLPFSPMVISGKITPVISILYANRESGVASNISPSY